MNSEAPPPDPTRDSAAAAEARRLAREARRREAERRAGERRTKGRDGKRVRSFRRFRRRMGGALLPYLAPPMLGLLRRSWRVEYLGSEHRAAVSTPRGFLVALWHGRMLPAIAIHHHQGHSALVSPSEDGTLAQALLVKNGYGVLRGTTSGGGGAAALRAMQQRLEQHPGGAFVITPDGPRGPRHSMNVGLAWLARESGLPILPLGVVSARAWRMRSWDEFNVPKPFSRIAVVYGEPLRVPPDADAWQLEKLSAGLRATIIETEKAGFAHLGLPVDWPSELG
ncbi:MAG: DUF374 domain-containing protein [Planctomycetes bacterium]|nr:DUF374 domain-containing protein [Planctomycetota bacterium]